MLHVSEANWRIKPHQLWIQRTREHRKWPSDHHHDIPILAKHVILGWCGEINVSDWVGRPQTYLWRPEELAKVSNYVFKDYVITKYKDIMHLLLSKEPHTNFREALKHKRKNYKQEEHKQFRPPDFEQDKHQDITGFIINKEAPLDPEYKTKPSKNRFWIRLTLWWTFMC